MYTPASDQSNPFCSGCGLTYQTKTKSNPKAREQFYVVAPLWRMEVPSSLPLLELKTMLLQQQTLNHVVRVYHKGVTVCAYGNPTRLRQDTFGSGRMTD